MKIVLGSASARRKELLELLGYEFLVFRPLVDENLSEYRNAADYAVRLAYKKGLETLLHFPEHLVICADTIVVANETILEKPRDKEEARKMMETLSGKDHRVITGVFMNFRDYRTVFSEITTVRIDELKAEEIEAYISTKEPYDKSEAMRFRAFSESMSVESTAIFTMSWGFPSTAFIGKSKK